MKKNLFISAIILTSLSSVILPASFTVSAATTTTTMEQSTYQEDSSVGNIESLNSYTDAVNQYLTVTDGVYTLNEKAKTIMTENDYTVLKNTVYDLNNPNTVRSARANSFRLTLSNQQAKTLVYNLGKATGAASIIAIIAGLGGVTAIISVAVAAAGITAGGLANQINYRNNGKGVTLDVCFTGIVVKSR